jgi:acetone carboxylase gamma subunit
MIIALKDYTTKMIMTCLKDKANFYKYLCFLVQAIDYQKSINLRYNTKTGRTHDNKHGQIAWFSNSKDIPADYSISDHIEWSLGSDIMNTASMMSRGCKL